MYVYIYMCVCWQTCEHACVYCACVMWWCTMGLRVCVHVCCVPGCLYICACVSHVCLAWCVWLYVVHSMCLIACMHVCTYVCLACMCAYDCVYAYDLMNVVLVCVRLYVFACMRVYACVMDLILCVSLWQCVYAQVYMYASHVCILVYVCLLWMCACKCVCDCACVPCLHAFDEVSYVCCMRLCVCAVVYMPANHVCVCVCDCICVNLSACVCVWCDGGVFSTCLACLCTCMMWACGCVHMYKYAWFRCMDVLVYMCAFHVRVLASLYEIACACLACINVYEGRDVSLSACMCMCVTWWCMMMDLLVCGPPCCVHVAVCVCVCIYIYVHVCMPCMHVCLELCILWLRARAAYEYVMNDVHAVCMRLMQCSMYYVCVRVCICAFHASVLLASLYVIACVPCMYAYFSPCILMYVCE